jgi:hypothetical protein
MSRPGIEPGPPTWEASTLEESHLDSLFAGYSELLLGPRLVSHPDLYMAPPSACAGMDLTGCSPNSPIALCIWPYEQVLRALIKVHVGVTTYRGP